MFCPESYKFLLIKMQVWFILESVFELFFPRHCAVCGRQLCRSEEFICLFCIYDFPLTYFDADSDNGMKMRFLKLWNTEESCSGDISGRRIDEDIPFAEKIRASSLFFYNPDSGFSSLTKDLKYRKNIKLGRYLSEIFADYLLRKGELRIEIIVPVPLHWLRKIKRGYNQAEVIGKVLAAKMNCEFSPGLLKRHCHTKSQAELPCDSKMENVKEAFVVDDDLFDECVKKGFRNLAVVDDVFTTGSTMVSCCRQIVSAFERRGIKDYTIFLLAPGFSG